MYTVFLASLVYALWLIPTANCSSDVKSLRVSRSVRWKAAIRGVRNECETASTRRNKD